MSANYYKIRGYYLRGLWSKERVRLMVGKPLGITAEEYEKITGEPYGAE